MSNRSRYAAVLMSKRQLWRDDVAAFAWDNFRFVPDDWQVEFFKNVVSHPRCAVKSGQGVGKTSGEAIAALWFLFCYKNAKVICTAPTKHQLNDVLWAEISKWQSKSPLLSALLKWTKTYIYVKGNEERWFAVARTATRAENMQGFHEKNMLFIVDEASGVSDEIMEAVQGTLSGENNRLILCGNPTKASGFFYDSFTAHRTLWQCQTVNAEDSPRTSKENIRAIAQKYGRDSNVFRVRVRGEFPTAEDDVFIPIGLAEAAIMNELPSTNGKYADISFGVDVARFGDDETVIVANKDGDCNVEVRRHGQDTMRTVGDVVRLYRSTLEHHPLYKGQIYVVIDDTGVGGGVTDRLAEVKREQRLLRLEIIAVNFGEKIPDESAALYYENLPTYMWAVLRERLSEKTLKLPNDNDLIGQLSTRKYIMTSKGKLVLESKAEMKNRKLESPDIADALALSCYRHKRFSLKNLI